jgi:ketosteroid isomerase-like protein
MFYKLYSGTLTGMKKLFVILAFALAACGGQKSDTIAKGSLTGTPEDREGLKRTTAAIRDAFARGDIDAILALHHPSIVKYFGGNNVMTGREEMRKQLTSWLRNNRVEFVENTVESTVFNGETAIETSIFEIRNVAKNGDSATIGRGRSMVVYIKYPQSPTGWASIREIVQEAPPR